MQIIFVLESLEISNQFCLPDDWCIYGSHVEWAQYGNMADVRFFEFFKF